jgi:hypothetical protein
MSDSDSHSALQLPKQIPCSNLDHPDFPSFTEPNEHSELGHNILCRC